MSVDLDEARALAHAFARQLEHLREFRGVRYFSGAPVPINPDFGLDSGLDFGLGADLEAEPGAEGGPGEHDEALVEAAHQRGAVAAERVPSPVEAAPREPESVAVGASPTRSTVASSNAETSVQLDAPRPTDDNRPRGKSAHSEESAQSPRTVNGGASAAGATPNQARNQARSWPAAKKLGHLRERSIGDCQRCPLAETRHNIVFGVGDPEADIMFIGEAPGAREDDRGEPFVGPAGRRLDRWIEQLGMQRADVFIANVLKCRPPNNRNPRPEEIERCSPFLRAQIRAIEPRVLIALGRFAGNLLLGRDLTLSAMRAKIHRYREPKSGAELPLVVTYHPSFVLRREQETRGGRAAAGQPDRGSAIKSEDEIVLADLARAVSLVRQRA